MMEPIRATRASAALDHLTSVGSRPVMAARRSDGLRIPSVSGAGTTLSSLPFEADAMSPRGYLAHLSRPNHWAILGPPGSGVRGRPVRPGRLAQLVRAQPSHG